jgi:hypothetical protein
VRQSINSRIDQTEPRPKAKYLKMHSWRRKRKKRKEEGLQAGTLG